ncbi:MAG: DUF512 domain-containing protein, partial [Acidimicrobiales bacterium]
VEYRLSPLYVSVHAADPVVRRWLLRNPEAPDVMEQLASLGAGGIRFHTQVVLVPAVNDGPQLERTIAALYDLGDPILSVSVVPVALTEFSKHRLVRVPGRDECRAALATVERAAARALLERVQPWCFGADELYLRADQPLPAAEWYGDFEQRENGVGAVRYLETRIAAAGGWPDGLAGARVGVVTGAAMGGLMPQVLEGLARATGANLETISVANTLFGPSVTTAGLLPGAAIRTALASRAHLDLALLPAEAVNDDGLLIDGVAAGELGAELPMELRWSYDFADVLAEAGVTA